MKIGKVVFWNSERGFGFIAVDDVKANNVFVHVRALRETGHVDPKIGDAFTFEVRAARDGKPEACNLHRAATP